tara:strand:+ start:1687 stop:1998 length:312 start_codon:yes stop_codon:yes gene_type:complete
MGFIDLYIFILYAIQILLSVNMAISIFYRIFRKDELVAIEKMKERKNTINFYFLILVSGLMLILFNPFAVNAIIEVKGELKSVLFQSAFLQIIFLLQQESTSV